MAPGKAPEPSLVELLRACGLSPQLARVLASQLELAHGRQDLRRLVRAMTVIP